MKLPTQAAQLARLDYVDAIDALLIRRETLERAIAELVPSSPWSETIGRLRCLRGIDTLSAVGLCADVGDFASLRHGSGGSGAHGGDGVIRELEALGADGGEPGARGRNLLDGEELPAKAIGVLAPGQSLRIETPAGGGHGKPPSSRP